MTETVDQLRQGGGGGGKWVSLAPAPSRDSRSAQSAELRHPVGRTRGAAMCCSRRYDSVSGLGGVTLIGVRGWLPAVCASV